MKHPYNLSSSTFLAIKNLRHFVNNTGIDVELTSSDVLKHKLLVVERGWKLMKCIPVILIEIIKLENVNARK